MSRDFFIVFFIKRNLHMNKNRIFPILVLAYNRPDFLRNLLVKLKIVGIDKLYISIDGPKLNDSTDKQLVSECISIAEEARSWTDLTLQVSEFNLGCYIGVSSAIDWFFAFEESGIILEDDLSFNVNLLRYLSVGLEIFESQKWIGSVCGYNQWNFQDSKIISGDMFTSKFPSSWGWATWKDRWLQLERNFGAPSKLSLFKTGFKNGGFSGIYHWMAIMTRLETGDLDSWAYRWLLTHFKHSWKAVLPPVNLVLNVGFREDATHTILSSDLERRFIDWDSKLKLDSILELRDNDEYEKWLIEKVYAIPSLRQILIRFLKRFCHINK